MYDIEYTSNKMNKKKEYVSQSWEIKEGKGKDTSAQKRVEGERRKAQSAE